MPYIPNTDPSRRWFAARAFMVQPASLVNNCADTDKPPTPGRLRLAFTNVLSGSRSRNYTFYKHRRFRVLCGISDWLKMAMNDENVACIGYFDVFRRPFRLSNGFFWASPIASITFIAYLILVQRVTHTDNSDNAD